MSDNKPPEFTMENTVISIDCDRVATIPNPTATDNCDANPTVSMSSSMSAGDCPNEWTEVYVWVATDSFGNSSNVTLTIHYTDTIAPVFKSVPATMEVACGADIPATTAEAGDNCGIVSVTYSDGSLQTGDCEDHYIRTFTAVDECGNSSTATQRINIIDTVPPVFTQIIADVVVACAADAPAIAIATAMDSCGSVDIQSESILLSSDSCGNYVQQVTYTAMDACGNIATQSYTITVLDTTAPVLSETPDSLVLDCLDSLPATPVITASDICQDSISVNYSEQFFGDAPTPGSIADCNLSTAPNTNPSWALWLQDLPVGYNYYITESAKLVEFPDGTAHLTGTVVSASNPDAGWIIDVWYMDGKNWADWSGQDAQTGFKDDAGLAGNNYLDWTFYITNGDSSTLTGTGDLAGSFFNLQHEPASRFYAFQVGVAANNFSAGYGMGGVGFIMRVLSRIRPCHLTKMGLLKMVLVTLPLKVIAAPFTMYIAPGRRPIVQETLPAGPKTSVLLICLKLQLLWKYPRHRTLIFPGILWLYPIFTPILPEA